MRGRGPAEFQRDVRHGGLRGSMGRSWFHVDALAMRRAPDTGPEARVVQQSSGPAQTETSLTSASRTTGPSGGEA